MSTNREEDETEISQRYTRSLFGEILDWMLAPLLLIWPLSIAATYVVAQSIANGPFDRALEDRLNLVAQSVVQRNQNLSVVLSENVDAVLRFDDLDELYFQVSTFDGKYLAGERILPGQPFKTTPRRRAQPSITASSKPEFRNETLNGNEIRVAAKIIQIPKGDMLLLVQVAETTHKRSQLANEIIKGVIFPQFIILPIAVLLVWFALSRGIAPLRELQMQIQARRPDDLSPISPEGTPEEITPLVEAFNELLQKQAQQQKQQQRFVADAAHQLRTPLAGIRAQAELALRTLDPAEVKHCLQQLLAGSAHATRLVNQLLTLARAESLPELPVQHPVALNELVRSTVQNWVGTALERSLDLGFEDCQELLTMRGDAHTLREMLNNLIDNALRYTPTAGHITVRLQLADYHTIKLSVEDNGIGIAEAERELVLQRFYRSLGTGMDGSGLGLAIVQEIVLRHSGILNIEFNPSSSDPARSGTIFTILFPRMIDH